MRKIRVGVLGYADIFSQQVGQAIIGHKQYDLVIVASRSRNEKEVKNSFQCLTTSSYENVIERDDIDMVYIPLPNSLHKEWVLKALSSGKHVLCEKSLGCSYQEVEEMVRLARKNRLLLIENFQFRFHSQHKFVKSLLENNEVGTIHSFRSSFGFPPFSNENDIRYKKELGGGALLDAGAYTLKALHFMMGSGYNVAAAKMNKPDGFNVDITGTIYAKNNDGVGAHLSYGFDNFYQCNYELWGSSGRIVSTRAFTAKPNFSPEIIIETSKGVRNEVLPPDNHFINMLTHFTECLVNENYETENIQNLEQAKMIEDVKIKSNE